MTSGEGIPFEDLGDNAELLPSESQAIITSYQFQRCGNITGWQTYVHPYSETYRKGAYSIVFQIWRPALGVDRDGCYSMEGEDRYEDIELYEETGGLVNRTLEPADYLRVQPGDVVGYYMSHRDRENRREGIQHALREQKKKERVWYLTNTPENYLVTGPQACLFNVGTSGILSSLADSAPVLKVQIGR